MIDSNVVVYELLSYKAAYSQPDEFPNGKLTYLCKRRIGFQFIVWNIGSRKPCFNQIVKTSLAWEIANKGIISEKNEI